MRVLKFGGTSVANAERFLRVADILESNAQQGQVATVLSAPAKITNHLVAMIEKTISGQDALPNISDATRIFAELLQGLAEAQPGFDYDGLKSRVDSEFAQLKQVLHGISLLGQCPDSVNAAIICRGEKLSIAIMEKLLEARGYGVSVIDPVEKLLAIGHYLESTVDIAESTRRIEASKIPAENMILMAGFTAGNERVSWSCWDVTVLTTRRRCWLPACAPIAVRSGPMWTGFILAIRARCRMLACLNPCLIRKPWSCPISGLKSCIHALSRLLHSFKSLA